MFLDNPKAIASCLLIPTTTLRNTFYTVLHLIIVLYILFDVEFSSAFPFFSFISPYKNWNSLPCSVFPQLMLLLVRSVETSGQKHKREDISGSKLNLPCHYFFCVCGRGEGEQHSLCFPSYIFYSLCPAYRLEKSLLDTFLLPSIHLFILHHFPTFPFLLLLPCTMELTLLPCLPFTVLPLRFVLHPQLPYRRLPSYPSFPNFEDVEFATNYATAEALQTRPRAVATQVLGCGGTRKTEEGARTEGDNPAVG